MQCWNIYLCILIFSCSEYIVVSELEGDSRLILNIDKIKKQQNNRIIEKRIVKGGNVCVVFDAGFHIEKAGLIEMNKKNPRWTPNNATLPNLEIDKSKTRILLDFDGPVGEKHAQMNLIVLFDSKTCNNSEWHYQSALKNACGYKLDRTNYMSRNYTITFSFTDYIKITANGKQLEPYSMSGEIPKNMVFKYEYKYRPGDHNFSCIYLGDESVITQWAEWPEVQLNPKTVSLYKSLKEENNNETFYVRYYKKHEINITAYIMLTYIPVADLLTVQINGVPLEDAKINRGYGEIYYSNSATYNIACGPSNMDVCRKENCSTTLHSYLRSSGISSSLITSGKLISKNITLRKEDNGTLVNCSYTSEDYEDIKTIVGIRFIQIQGKTDMKLKLNGTEIKPGTSSHDIPIDDEGQIDVFCSVVVTYNSLLIPDIPMQLLLKQNGLIIPGGVKDLIIINQDENMTVKKAFIESKNIQINDNDDFTCILIEKYEDAVYENITATVKKRELSTIPPSDAPPGTKVKPGDDPEQSKVSASNGDIFSDSWYFYAIIPCAGIVIIVIIVCIIKVSRSKPRDAEELVPAEYETVNDTPPPPNFPQNATLEETYCRPTDSKNTEPTYAQPYVPKSTEELYSKPVPKIARKKPVKDTPYASLEFENAYAKVKSKSERNKQFEEPSYADVRKIKDEPTYASIETKKQFEEPGYAGVRKFNETPTYAAIQQYANVKSQDENREEYYNVFDNSSYANSKQNAEYVEPSYCEIGKVKK